MTKETRIQKAAGTLTIYIKSGQKRELAKIAKAEKRSLSYIVGELIAKHLESREAVTA